MRSPHWRQVKQCPVLVALQEAIEPFHEPGHGRRVGLADVVDVGADQDQAAGAVLAVGGGEARLGAADLAGEGVALAALSLLERFFLRREFLLEGRLPGYSTPRRRGMSVTSVHHTWFGRVIGRSRSREGEIPGRE